MGMENRILVFKILVVLVGVLYKCLEKKKKSGKGIWMFVIIEIDFMVWCCFGY